MCHTEYTTIPSSRRWIPSRARGYYPGGRQQATMSSSVIADDPPLFLSTVKYLGKCKQLTWMTVMIVAPDRSEVTPPVYGFREPTWACMLGSREANEFCLFESIMMLREKLWRLLNLSMLFLHKIFAALRTISESFLLMQRVRCTHSSVFFS
jgi:hypothetical protein